MEIYHSSKSREGGGRITLHFKINCHTPTTSDQEQQEIGWLYNGMWFHCIPQVTNVELVTLPLFHGILEMERNWERGGGLAHWCKNLKKSVYIKQRNKKIPKYKQYFMSLKLTEKQCGRNDFSFNVASVFDEIVNHIWNKVFKCYLGWHNSKNEDFLWVPSWFSNAILTDITVRMKISYVFHHVCVPNRCVYIYTYIYFEDKIKWKWSKLFSI